MIDVQRLPSHVRSSLLEAEYTVEEIKQWTASECFEKFCEWHGLINWASTLTHALDGIREAVHQTDVPLER